MKRYIWAIPVALFTFLYGSMGQIVTNLVGGLTAAHTISFNRELNWTEDQVFEDQRLLNTEAFLLILHNGSPVDRTVRVSKRPFNSLANSLLLMDHSDLTQPVFEQSEGRGEVQGILEFENLRIPKYSTNALLVLSPSDAQAQLDTPSLVVRAEGKDLAGAFILAPVELATYCGLLLALGLAIGFNASDLKKPIQRFWTYWKSTGL